MKSEAAATLDASRSRLFRTLRLTLHGRAPGTDPKLPAHALDPHSPRLRDRPAGNCLRRLVGRDLGPHSGTGVDRNPNRMDKSESLLRSGRRSPRGDLYSDANVRGDSRLTSAPSLSGCLSVGTGRRRSCTGGASSTWRPERNAAIPGRFSRLQRRQLQPLQAPSGDLLSPSGRENLDGPHLTTSASGPRRVRRSPLTGPRTPWCGRRVAGRATAGSR